MVGDRRVQGNCGSCHAARCAAAGCAGPAALSAQRKMIFSLSSHHTGFVQHPVHLLRFEHMMAPLFFFFALACTYRSAVSQHHPICKPITTTKSLDRTASYIETQQRQRLGYGKEGGVVEMNKTARQVTLCFATFSTH
jgi:hypothetical protein